MNFQSILQVYYNWRKMISVVVLVLLSYLVLAFIISLSWPAYLSASQPPVSLNFDNIHEINLEWDKTLLEDSTLLAVQKKILLTTLKKRKEILTLSYTPAEFLTSNLRTPYTYSSDKYLIKRADLNFIETFGLKLLSGRDFLEKDLLNPIPAVIIPQSLAKKENIILTNKEFILNLKNFHGKKKERKFRVVGIVEDVSYFNDFDKFTSLIFSYESKLLLKTRSKIYLKANQKLERSELTKIISEVIESESLNSSIQSANIQSAEDLLKANVIDFFEDFRSIIAILVLLTLYVFGTLYGVFYRYVLNKGDEFAIRRSFGCTRWQVYGKVMSEALLYALSGILIGSFLFLNIAILSGFDSILYATIFPVVVILVIVIFSVFIPALYISRQTPVEAFHDE